jgi:glyoxylase-like metal-dependent hydrolase (beta-lactamase superfamily II)
LAFEYRVISIGTLAANPLWNEGAEARTGHATTTLISAESGTHILVDPSLPATALLARLGERAPVRASQVTHVFLTSADPLHHRAIGVFEEAEWLAHESELIAARAAVAARLEEARAEDDRELGAALQGELDVLGRCRPAPDKLAGGVDLFPLPGVTPGACGLLLPLPAATLVICGDAVPTVEHLLQGKVLPHCHDVEQAQESFAEAIQIADLLIPGRDNLTVNPIRRPFGL